MFFWGRGVHLCPRGKCHNPACTSKSRHTCAHAVYTTPNGVLHRNYYNIAIFHACACVVFMFRLYLLQFTSPSQYRYKGICVIFSMFSRSDNNASVYDVAWIDFAGGLNSTIYLFITNKPRKLHFYYLFIQKLHITLLYKTNSKTGIL